MLPTRPMKNRQHYLILHVALVMGVPHAGFGTPDAGGNSTETSAPLGTNEVARIGNEVIPYNWFLHEFRSTFYKYGETPDARRKVFDPFLDKMVLYTVAKKATGNDVAAAQKIEERIQNMREFMEYQLVMTRVQMTIENYLQEQALDENHFSVSEGELKAFISAELVQHPEALQQSFADVPASVKKQLEIRLRREKQNRAVQDLTHKLMSELPIDINEPLIESVPFPQITRTNSSPSEMAR